MKNKNIKTICVDLLPLLPGGDNGGAKIFVLELLQAMAKAAPEINFILLTNSLSHDELAKIDSKNICRLLIQKRVENGSLNLKMITLYQYIISYLPLTLRTLVGLIGYKFLVIFKRIELERKSTLKELQADLLFCPFTAPTFYSPTVPTVCTIYDLQFKKYPQFFKKEELVHRELVFFEACKKATVLTAISDYSRNSVIKYGNVEPSRIRTILLRLPQRMLKNGKNESEILSHFGLKSKRFFFYPANYWEHKNHELLLTAFGMARNMGLPEDFMLVFTGAPNLREIWLKKAVSAMKVDEFVVFGGYLETVDFDVLLANCNSLVFPSLYEGFGLPLVEAMLAGVPVICSNNSALIEVAGNAAKVFDPRKPLDIAKTMISISSDEQLRAKLTKEGELQAVMYSDSERMCKEYLNVFKFAVETEKEHVKQFELVGIFDDGWVVDYLEIVFPPFSDCITIEIDLFTPNWSPIKELTIISSYEKEISMAVTQGGGTSKYLITLSKEYIKNKLEMNISPTFIPTYYGISVDQRKLSAILKRCLVICADGKSVELYKSVETS